MSELLGYNFNMTVFLSCCSDSPSYMYNLTNSTQIDWTTWAIWAAVKK